MAENEQKDESREGLLREIREKETRELEREREENATQTTSSSSRPPTSTPGTIQQFEVEEDEDEEESLEYHAETVMTIMKPVSLTMLFVIWAVKIITIPGRDEVGFVMAYNEQSTDSTGKKIGGAILNALMFLGLILVTTVVFVCLYKYRCMKIIYGWLITASLMLLAAFGGLFSYLLFQALNWTVDLISFSFILWNFAVVGIIAIFWHGPTKVNQGYLILISGLMAIFFSQLPDWTTFAVLAIVAIYDLFAVLCPRGPLKVLVETAQQRQEPIPALLYNASVFTMMADRADEGSSVRYRPDEDSAPQTPPSPRTTAPRQLEPEQQARQSKRKGVKLGLGDFVFYSVLIGRAAMYDMITVFTCFIGIITGLFFTLLLFAIFRKALPALPISIAFGLLFYFLTRIFLLPFVIVCGKNLVFV